MEGQTKKDDWYRLDNAAKIYPPVISSELTSVFRLSCSLNERVKIGTLMKAARITAARFPYFNVTLRRGFFWYYLECSDTEPTVAGEERRPLTRFPVKSVSLSLYRILARGTKISVEFLHVIADGSGAMEYFRSLLVTYLRLSGNSIEYSEGVIDPSSE
ncbi:MAG: alcohol acetyltransferase, partial [Bacteroidia bacterium]